MKKIITIVTLMASLVIGISVSADSKNSMKSKLDALNNQYTLVNKQYTEAKSEANRYADMYKHASLMNKYSEDLKKIDGKDKTINQSKKDAEKAILILKEQIRIKLIPLKHKAEQLKDKRDAIKREINKLNDSRFDKATGKIK